jgi:hypothetical protein
MDLPLEPRYQPALQLLNNVGTVKNWGTLEVELNAFFI